MPGGDGTGPMGRESMTGRGRGFCSREEAPRFSRGGFGGGGRGFGRGAGGGGRGWRNQFWATGLPGWRRGTAVAPADAENDAAALDELQRLERRTAELEEEQAMIRARRAELEGR